MSYGPGRSPLLQGTLVGTGAWVVGAALTVVLAGFVFGVADPDPVVRSLQIYPLAVVWFLGVAVGGLTPAVLVTGLSTSVVLVASGVVAVVRVHTVADAWDAGKVGLVTGLGHGVVTAAVFAWLGPVGVASWSTSGRTFVLVFGGFLVPGMLGAVGAVCYQQFAAR